MGKRCCGKCSDYSDTYKILSYVDKSDDGRPARYCCECMYYRYTNEFWCGCCGTKLRTKPARLPNSKPLKGIGRPHSNTTLVFMAQVDRRVMQYLQTNQTFDWTSNDIRKGLGEKWTRTIQKSINRLIQESKVVKVRNIGKLYTYQTPEWVDNRLYTVSTQQQPLLSKG